MYYCTIATMTYERFHIQLAAESYVRSGGLGFCPSTVANRHCDWARFCHFETVFFQITQGKRDKIIFLIPSSFNVL